MGKTTIFQIPLKIQSEANCSEHWVKKKKRHDTQKWVVKKVWLDNGFNFNLPIEITLIRVSPRCLDQEDNLPMSFKWIKDSIADCIIPGKAPGRADDCKQITWKFDQKRGKVRENYIEVIIEEK